MCIIIFFGKGYMSSTARQVAGNKTDDLADFF